MIYFVWIHSQWEGVLSVKTGRKTEPVYAKTTKKFIFIFKWYYRLNRRVIIFYHFDVYGKGHFSGTLAFLSTYFSNNIFWHPICWKKTFRRRLFWPFFRPLFSVFFYLFRHFFIVFFRFFIFFDQTFLENLQTIMLYIYVLSEFFTVRKKFTRFFFNIFLEKLILDIFKMSKIEIRKKLLNFFS